MRPIAPTSGATLAALQEALQSNPLLAGQSAKLLPGGAAMLSLVPLLSGAKPLVKPDDDASLQPTRRRRRSAARCRARSR